MRKRSSSETNLYAWHLHESEGKLSRTLSTDNDISPALSAAQSFKNARMFARDQITFITPAINKNNSTNEPAISSKATLEVCPKKYSKTAKNSECDSNDSSEEAEGVADLPMPSGSKMSAR